MLEIFNKLALFAEDCYKRISVREYSKLIKFSPPTASKILKELNKKGLLKKESFRNHLFFWANRENKLFVELTRIYWLQKLDDLIKYINKISANPTLILFGSLAKAENKSDSDIDLAIIGIKKELNLTQFEKKLKKNIQLFQYNTLKDIKNKELLNNILNGYILSGRLKL